MCVCQMQLDEMKDRKDRKIMDCLGVLICIPNIPKSSSCLTNSGGKCIARLLASCKIAFSILGHFTYNTSPTSEYRLLKSCSI